MLRRYLPWVEYLWEPHQLKSPSLPEWLAARPQGKPGTTLKTVLIYWQKSYRWPFTFTPFICEHGTLTGRCEGNLCFGPFSTNILRKTHYILSKRMLLDKSKIDKQENENVSLHSYIDIFTTGIKGMWTRMKTECNLWCHNRLCVDKSNSLWLDILHQPNGTHKYAF